MKLSIAISILSLFLITQNLYSQRTVAELGNIGLASDSAVIYTSPIDSFVHFSDSLLCDNIVLKRLMKRNVRLADKSKTEFANLLTKPSNFSGRFPSRSGFKPTEIIALWKDGTVACIKVSRATHDLLYLDNFVSIDPVIADRITKFYSKIKLKPK